MVWLEDKRKLCQSQCTPNRGEKGKKPILRLVRGAARRHVGGNGGAGAAGVDLLQQRGGALGSILFVLETALRGGEPSLPYLNPFLGVRYEVAQMLNAVPDALSSSMIFFLMLFLLRVLLRKQWIAATVFVAIMSIIPAIGSATPRVAMLENALFFGALTFVLLRFGLLAAIVGFTCYGLLELCPPTLDVSAWYIGLAPIPLLAVALIAIYGFRTSLAGRPLFPISGD
jgi:hypothetical protein